MAKCIACNDRERAYQDENFCADCRKAAEERARTVNPQPSTVPLGQPCYRHSSALAHWRAETITLHGVFTRYLCDHCWRVDHAALEADGWAVTGSPVVCTCVACDRQQAVAAS